MNIHRQGDILLIQIPQLPEGLAPVEREEGRIVLAHGEVTGHAHVWNGEAELLAFDPADLDEMSDRFLAVEHGCLIHDEHDPVVLDPGTHWIIRRQREYQTNNAIVPVRD